MGLHVQFSQKALEAFCRKWHVRELAVFGSVLRDDFRPDSDVDVLVEPEVGVVWSFRDLLQMSEELESLFGRKVDLVEKRVILQSRNWIRREHILRNMERIYVAG